MTEWSDIGTFADEPRAPTWKSIEDPWATVGQYAEAPQPTNLWRTAQLGYNRSIQGLLFEYKHGKPKHSLEGFEPTLLEDVAATMFSFLTPIDAATFALTGGVGGLAAKGVVRGVTSQVVKQMVRRGATREAAEIAARKGLTKVLTTTAQRGIATGIGLGGYTGRHAKAAQLAATGEVDYGQVLEAAGKAFVTGGAAGVAAGAMAGIGAPVVAQLGGEIAAFGTVGPLIEGELPTPRDYAHAAGVILGMRTLHKGFTELNKARKALASDIRGDVESGELTFDESVERAANIVGARSKLRADLFRAFPKEKQEIIEGAVVAMESRADRRGISLGQLMEELKVDIEPAREIIRRGEITERVGERGPVRGGFQEMEDGRIIIKAYKSANVMSLSRQMARLFRRTLTPEEREPFEKWLGVKEGVEWTRAQENKFASGFAKWLKSGRTANPQLVESFAAYGRHLGKIYKKLDSSVVDIKVPKSIRDAFNNMLKRSERAEYQPDYVNEQGMRKVGHKVGKHFDPFISLPKGERYLDISNAMAGQMHILKGKLDNFVKTFKIFSSDERKLAVKVMRGEAKLSELEHLPELYRTTKEVIGEFKTVGQELVSRGLMDKKGFEAMKGNYLTNVYLAHLLLEGPSLGGRFKMSLAYRHGRKPLTPEQQAELGLIDTPELPVQIGLTREWGDVHKFDFFNRVMDVPEFVMPSSIVNVGGLRMGIGYVDKLLSVYEDVRRSADKGQLPAVEKKLMRLQRAKDTLEAVTGQRSEDFTRVPNRPEYGVLQGAMVRREIADDIMSRFEITDPSDYRKFTNKVLSVERKLTARWKALKVPFNPPTIMRNFVSNIFQLNMSGMNLPRVFNMMSTAADSMKAKDRLYRLAVENGVFGKTFGEAEIDLILRERTKLKVGAKGTVLKVPYSFFGNLGRFYGKIDEFYKFVKFIDGVEKGLSPAEATRDAHKWVMDYTRVSPLVRTLREHIIGMPFITYQSKILPLMIEAMRKRPWVFAKYVAAPAALAAWALSEDDVSEEDWTTMQRSMSEYVKKAAFMLVPGRDQQGRMQVMNLEYFFPWGNWVEVFKNVREAKVGTAVAALGQNPILMFLAAMYTGVEPGTKREIWSPLDDPVDRSKRTFEYLYDLAMPGWMASYGAGARTLQAVGMKDVNIFDPTVSPEQAAVRWIGLNVNPIDVARGLFKQSKIYEAKLRELNIARSREIKKAVSYGGPDMDKIQTIQEKYADKVTELALEFLEPSDLFQERIRKLLSGR